MAYPNRGTKSLVQRLPTSRLTPPRNPLLHTPAAQPRSPNLNTKKRHCNQYLSQVHTDYDYGGVTRGWMFEIGDIIFLYLR